MSRFTASKTPFGKPPPGQQSGLSLAAIERAAAQVKEAAGLAAHIPEEGSAFHALMTGRCDVMAFVSALPAVMGPIDELRIATLSYNGRNLQAMLAMMDGGHSKRLTLLCSAFFRDHNKELWAETRQAFRDRGQRVAAARTHAKVICAHFASGRKLACEGSANLRANGNAEQITLLSVPEVHDWHSVWIDQLVTAHEGEGDGEEEIEREVRAERRAE